MSPTDAQRRWSPRGGLGRASRLLGLALLAALVASPALAQDTGRITGEVVNATNAEPLSGAQVFLEGTEQGTLTNNAGRFMMLNVQPGTYTLRVQMIGYGEDSREISLQSGQSLAVTFELYSQAVELDEVVVTGTPGNSRRREIGNSVSSISSDELLNAAVTNVGDVLQGRSAGTTVMQNSGMVGAGGSIRLRGNNSITAGNSPLIYVDGVRIKSSAYQGDPETNQAPNPFDDINPENIERVEIVKGAAATTLYGTEAAGGVIQIFTKRGSEGEPRWSFSSQQGINYLNDYGPEEDPTGLGLVDCTAEPNCPESGSWLRDGHVQKYNLSVRGGTGSTSYFLSGRWDRSEGIIAPQHARDWGVRGNFSFQPREDLNIQFNNVYSTRRIRWIPDGNNAEGLLLNTFRGAAGYTPDNDNSKVMEMKLWQANHHFISGMNATWNPIAGVTQRLNLGVDWTQSDYTEERPWGFFYVPNGSREDDASNERILTFDYAGTWDADVTNGLTSSFAWGGQLYHEYLWGLTGFGDDFAGPGDKVVNSAARTSAFEARRSIASGGFFLQERVGWQDRAFLTAGVRWDGFSTFGSGFGLAMYPKVSGTYMLSDHQFWPEWWQTLKLRASVGESGKAPGTFDAARVWRATSGDEGQPGLIPANKGNPELGPERTREVEAGFDASAFDGRASLEFTYYNQLTEDGLLRVQQTPSQGFLGSGGTQLENVAKVRNVGTETSLNVTVLRNRDINWDIGGHFSTNVSEVLDLGPFEEVYLGWRQYAKVGQPLVGFYNDYVQNPDEVGEEPDMEKSYRGTTYPTHTFALSTTLTFDRLTIDLLGEGQGGHVIPLGTAHQNTRRGAWAPCDDIQEQYAANKAKHENDPTFNKFQGLKAYDTARCTADYSTYGMWTLPADFFKLRSASLSYRVPESWLPTNIGSATVNVKGRNLFTITDLPGLDPEAYEDGARNFALFRQEYYTLPPYQQVVMGLKVNF